MKFAGEFLNKLPTQAHLLFFFSLANAFLCSFKLILDVHSVDGKLFLFTQNVWSKFFFICAVVQQ